MSGVFRRSFLRRQCFVVADILHSSPNEPFASLHRINTEFSRNDIDTIVVVDD